MSGSRIDHKLLKKEGKAVAFSPELAEKVQVLFSRYPAGRQKSALLPLLHMVQEAFGGYLTVDLMDHIAGLIGIKPIEVYEVATFYSMYNLDKVGKYVIEVCQTGPCAMCGGESILDYLQEKLKIKAGETTADGLFTLKTAECLGACGYAPVMQINTKFYEFLTKEKIDTIIEELSRNSNNSNPSSERWAEKFF
ncbi:MAG: NAD(P)H-dependent oxidoreductase subunit E [Bacteroidota bacterium]